jgi:polyhydroxyalkanoate synthesis regulator phasin
MSLTIAKTQTDQNGNIIEVNAPKPLYVGSTLLTTPALALGDIKSTGIQKANDARIHVCDIVAALNKDIKALKSFISGIIAKIKAAIEALLTALSQNPFVEELKQKVQSLKAKAKLIAQSIKDALDEQSAITEYVTYLKNLINTISNASAEVRKLLQSCLSNAQSDLAIYQGKLNNSALNTLQTQLNSVNQQVKALA